MRLVWAAVFYEKKTVPSGTWLGFAEFLASAKLRAVPEKYVVEAREACRTLYSCAAIREDVAEELLEATEKLLEAIIGEAPRSKGTAPPPPQFRRSIVPGKLFICFGLGFLYSFQT